MIDALQRLIIVTGMAGAGKTVVLHALEDHDYYCVDNLPAGLLTDFTDHIGKQPNASYRNVAVGIDARSPKEDLHTFTEHWHNLKSRKPSAELIFVSASDEALIRRFSETRRRHPLSAGGLSLAKAIERERSLLAPLAEQSDLMLDTSDSYVHQLRDTIRHRVVRQPDDILSLQLLSFGFKHGVPPDADFVFDVRFLPNPHWEPLLRDKSGLDASVIDYLERAPAVMETLQEIGDLLERWISRFEADNRSYLTVAIGCTGGQHRSVYIAERLSQRLRDAGKRVITAHRDL